VYTQETTPTTAPAPSVPLDTAGREHIKALATASAVPMSGDCQHCGGSGRDRATAQQVVHGFGPFWFGETWDLGRLHAAIDSADHIRWVDDPGGRDLVVVIDGEPYQFQVKRPAQAEDAA
jgi:hypothetical protein